MQRKLINRVQLNTKITFQTKIFMTTTDNKIKNLFSIPGLFYSCVSQSEHDKIIAEKDAIAQLFMF